MLGFTLGFQVKPVDAGSWLSCIRGVMRVLMRIQSETLSISVGSSQTACHVLVGSWKCFSFGKSNLGSWLFLTGSNMQILV